MTPTCQAMKKAFEILDGFGVTYDVAIASAHRTPKKLAEFVAAEEEKGAGAFIAGAGMAAAPSGCGSQPDFKTSHRRTALRRKARRVWWRSSPLCRCHPESR